jgi:hypothetical protein
MGGVAEPCLICDFSYTETARAQQITRRHQAHLSPEHGRGVFVDP